MKFLSLDLYNFRRYESAKFKFNPKFTVLIGDNGKGKTTILDALAILLSTYFQNSGLKTGQGGIRKSDARFVTREKGGQVFLERMKKVSLVGTGIIDEVHPIEWRRDIGDRGAKAKDLIEIGKQHRDQIHKGENINLPLFLYYGSGRLWNTTRDRSTTKPSSQLDAYHFCLDPKSDQKAFEKWYKRLTYSALQKGQTSSALQVIEQVILNCIPEAQNVYYDVEEDQIMLHITVGDRIPFDSLSDGYRNMVAMVADVAYRSAILNPHLGVNAAQQTAGIILIDEIDLHLHPKWQRQVVSDLRRTFPQLQFIATTHSPFILQSLEPGEVIDLNQEINLDGVEETHQDIAMPSPNDRYSHQPIEDIVENVMGVAVPQRSERYQQMYNTAQEYYRVLQEGNTVSEEEKTRLKQRLDELSAPFSDNVAYHAFLEMERLAAGLGSSQQREIKS